MNCCLAGNGRGREVKLKRSRGVDLQKWKDRVLYYPGSLLLLAWLPTYLKFKQDLKNPLKAQERKLMGILAANEQTEYGRKYGFGQIKSIRQFQEQVPIIGYDAIRDEVQRMTRGGRNILTHQDPDFFIITSGTSGEAKYIPVTLDFSREYQSKLWFFDLLRQHPRIAYFKAILALVTTDAGVTAGGHQVGASSGYLYRAQSRVAHLAYTLPYQVFTIEDWDAKYYTILRLSAASPIRLLTTNNPSSLIVLAQKAAQFQERLLVDIEKGTLDAGLAMQPALRRSLERRLRPDPGKARRLRAVLQQQGGNLNPGTLWPDLQAICCWTDGPARFYLPQLKQLYGAVPVHNMGYLASEGRGSIPWEGDGVLAIRSHFFEFIPAGENVREAATVLTCDQLEAGQDYSVLFTASHGLYRYLINDIVRVKGFRERTPVIEFNYRAGNTFDFTGEKLYEAQVEGGMSRALDRVGVQVADYAVMPTAGQPPFYRLAIEAGLGAGPEALEQLREEFEEELIRGNISYAGKLASKVIGPLQLATLPPGTFENFFKYRVEEEGAAYSQIKIGHLNPSPAFVKFLKTNSLLPEG